MDDIIGERGVIKLYRADKGYGFIHCQNGDELFFHISRAKSPEENLTQDTKVEFFRETNERDGRIMAVAVKVLPEADGSAENTGV